MDRIRNFIKTISYGERNRRQVIQYKEKVKKYVEMDTDEFDMNYIATISSYEHKKIVLAVTAGISIALAVSGIWRDMFYVIKQYFFLIYAESAAAVELTKAALAITLAVLFFVFFLLTVIILDLSNGMKKLIAEKNFFENLRKCRKST